MILLPRPFKTIGYFILLGNLLALLALILELIPSISHENFKFIWEYTLTVSFALIAFSKWPVEDERSTHIRLQGFVFGILYVLIGYLLNPLLDLLFSNPFTTEKSSHPLLSIFIIYFVTVAYRRSRDS